MHNIYDDDETVLRQKLYDLELEHRDLDDIIARLNNDLEQDQLQLGRFKKRKLITKDLIAKLKAKLIPDEPA